MAVVSWEPRFIKTIKIIEIKFQLVSNFLGCLLLETGGIILGWINFICCFIMWLLGAFGFTYYTMKPATIKFVYERYNYGHGEMKFENNSYSDRTELYHSKLCWKDVETSTNFS